MHIEKKKQINMIQNFLEILDLDMELDGAMLYPLHIFDHNRISQWFASF